MDKRGEQHGMWGIFIVMIISLTVAFSWQKFPVIKNIAHAVLNPTAGALLNWNVTIGMAILVLIISFFMTLIQKHATDQKMMREMKEEQKQVQEDIKKYRDHPEKLMHLQKKQMEFAGKMMSMSTRPLMYTAIPIILFFRWFNDFFLAYGDFKFFGIFSWFWFYLIGSIIFSSILRKVLKVA